MIYTSYYANTKNFPSNSVLVQISRGVPKYFKAHTSIIEFMPSYDLLSDYKKG